MICSTSSFSARKLLLVAALLTIAAQVAEGQVRPAGEAWHAPAHTDRPHLAVLPVENLSGVKAPLDEIRRLVVAESSYGGFKGIDEAALASFMRAHRLRYTGGVSGTTARAGREELGADAILITSVETFRAGPLPRATLHCRLVSTGEEPTILWADSVGLAGDDAPGLLGLGLITDEHVLLKKAVHALLKPLLEASRDWTSGITPVADTEARGRQRGTRAGHRARRWSPNLSTEVDVAARYAARFRPHTHFRSDAVDFSAPHTVAVIPFLNVSERKYAGKILALHFVNELRRCANLRVLEPGVVRERLLTTRSIMAGGPSLAVADLFFHQEFPPVDLILSGEIFDYQDREGVAKVDFSAHVFDKETREMVWFSRSYNRGDEDVLFFDLGRERTAHGVTTRMVGSAMARMLR
jgi:TolB-like protein